MKRAKNLNAQSVLDITRILDVWKGDLNWELLINEIERATAQRYTRQTLHKHARIFDAFRVTKERLKRAAPERKTIRSRDQETIELLRAEVKRLEFENDNLLGQTARWGYNARNRGLSLEYLNQPLPPIDRGQTPKPR
jgi:hypothetical protein